MKQTSWFKTEVDFEPSFKFWFALMWQNSYIQIFLVAFSLLIVEIFSLPWVVYQIEDAFDSGIFTGIFVSAGTLILPGIVFALSYLGFYKFYKEIKDEYFRKKKIQEDWEKLKEATKKTGGL